MDKEKRVHKITFVLIAIITIFVFSNMVIASAIPVNIVEPEVKEITNTKKVNSKIEPYRDIQISSKTGGIIDGVNVSTGQFVEKGQPLMIFEQDNIEIQIEQAEAALEIAKANHKKMKDGATDEQIKTAKAGVKQAAASLKIARANYEMLKEGAAEEDLKSLQAAYQQAVSSYEGAEKNLQLFESSYEDRIMDKQQLNSAETQLLSAEKQVEVAEERLEQAKIGLKQAENGLRQAENEYERIKYLYEENVVTKKQYE
ncbi:MAG: HlyD family secretion protein, partial [Bacillota bacterium]